MSRLGGGGGDARLTTAETEEAGDDDNGADFDEGGGTENIQVKSLADIRREKLLQRLGRPSAQPAGDVGEDIKREKLMQRLGNRPLKRKTEEEPSSGLGMKKVQGIKRGRLQDRLGRTNETEEDADDDGDFDPDKIQVKIRISCMYQLFI